MNMFDIICLVIISMATFFGIWKGLVKQVLGVAGVVVGYIASMKFYEQFAASLPDMGANVTKIVSFIGIFIACLIAASLISWGIGIIYERTGLGWVNKLGGGVLGFFKGSLIIMIITLILIAFLPADSSLLTESITLPYTITYTNALRNVIPDDMKNKYNEKLLEIRSLWVEKALKKE